MPGEAATLTQISGGFCEGGLDDVGWTTAAVEEDVGWPTAAVEEDVEDGEAEPLALPLWLPDGDGWGDVLGPWGSAWHSVAGEAAVAWEPARAAAVVPVHTKATPAHTANTEDPARFPRRGMPGPDPPLGVNWRFSIMG